MWNANWKNQSFDRNNNSYFINVFFPFFVNYSSCFWSPTFASSSTATARWGGPEQTSTRRKTARAIHPCTPASKAFTRETFTADWRMFSLNQLHQCPEQKSLWSTENPVKPHFFYGRSLFNVELCSFQWLIHLYTGVSVSEQRWVSVFEWV